MKTKTIPAKDYFQELSNYPNFSATGSVKGMKKKYYGKDALLVRCGSYIYNVTDSPTIYYDKAK